MNIILFGPPGVGKSTLISVLKSQGMRAIDLEDVYPNRIRFQLPSYLEDAFIGAADLNPKRRYNNSLKVLVYADQALYDARRAQRDAKIPGKASQSQHQIANWLKGVKYDFLLDTSHMDASKAAQLLINLQKGGLDNGN